MQRILTREQMLIGGTYKVVYKETLAQLVILADGTKLQDWIDENPGGGSGPPGPAGTSLVLLGELNSTAELPSTGQELGHCYLISGDLWSYIASTDPLAVNGFIKAGHISGLSAYEIWLSNGNVGTEEDFLESLNGLSAYEIWLATGNIGTELDFLNSLKGSDGVIGVDGKSAYEIWLAAGNVGTEAVFLNSLKGKSAYQVWLDTGNTGAVEDYLESLEGVSITEATVNGSGNLLITLSTGSVLNAGYVKGSDGTSINILGNLASTVELPDSGQTIGDCYLITGNLWVYTASSEPAAVNGFINAGNITGPEGRGVTSLTINGSGNLLVTYSDAVQTDLGRVIGRSAYEIAVLEGFVGTRPEWLESLKGLTTSVNGVEQVEGEITLTTTNIADSTDARYVTDAQKTVLENTSGTNTGDETNTTIKTKLGSASTTTDGYLTKEDFIIFTNKVDKSGDTMTGELNLPVIELQTDYTPTGLEPVGSSYYDQEERCVTTVLPNSKLQNGRELYRVVLDNIGTPIPNGSLVYVSGAVGNSVTLTGGLFIANGTISDIKVAGIATHDIANGQKGDVTCFGAVRGLNTTGSQYEETWEEGDTIYASATVAGALTNIAPQAPNMTIKVAEVVNKHATNGMLDVKIVLRSKLTDLYDVNGTPLTENGQLMTWDNDRKVFDFTDNLNNYKLSDSVSGTTVSISDAEDNVYFNNIIVNGRTTQKTYDGVQIIPFTLASLKSGNTAGIWSGNNYKVSGITFVVSTDSENNVTSITALGTASANVTLMLKTPSGGLTIATATSHTLTGCPTGGSETTYYLRVQNYEDSAGAVWKSNQDDIGSGKVFSTNYLYFNCYIRINSGVTVSNKIFTPMLTTTAVRPHAYEPYVGNIPAPNILFPQPLVGVGNDLTLKLTIGVDNIHTDDTEVSIVLPTPLYNTDYFGLYTKELCLSKGITYDETKEGLWGIFQNSNKILSYNSEVITGDYDSTTGALDIGATVVYYENTVHSFVPLANLEQYKLNTLKQKGSTMYITNADTAAMEIMYNKKSSTIGTICSRIATHIEDSDMHGSYSMLKQVVAEDGYITTYQLTKNGLPLGSKINIPKDYLVKSGTLETCSQNDVPVAGYTVGDVYLDFVVNTTENTGNLSHIYIKVTDLLDVYTAGDGVDITNNSISVVINSVSNGLFNNSQGVGLNLATSTTNGAFSSQEKVKVNNIKKSIIGTTALQLSSSNWMGTSAPYTMDITVSIPEYTVTSIDDIDINPVYNMLDVNLTKAEMEAYSYISTGEITADNTLRLTCYDYKPVTDLSVSVDVYRDFNREELMSYIDSKVTDISTFDLNNLSNIGLYFGYACINTPITTSLGYFSLQVHGRPGYIVQTLVDTTTSAVFVRTYTGGAWSVWEKLSGSIKGMSYYAATHSCGSNPGSGTWIAGDTVPDEDFRTRARSTIVMGSDTLKKSHNIGSTIAIGDGIMNAGNIGNHNIGIGLWALHCLSIGADDPNGSGDRNIAIGSLSFTALVKGRCNTGLGRDTAQCCVEGNYNIALGYASMGGGAPVGLDKKIACWWDGTYSFNTAIGTNAGHDLFSSQGDTFIGRSAGATIKQGSWNNIIGYNSGINLEGNRTHNGKKLVVMEPYDVGTYTTDGTNQITVTYTGHQAQVGNYVIFYCTNGPIRTITLDKQLLYVASVSGNTFTLTAPATIPTGSGSIELQKYEVEIPGGETIGVANSSNILGVGAYYFPYTIQQSNVVGMRASNKTECTNSDIMGYATFYGVTTSGVAVESQIIGSQSCYKVTDIKYSSVVGYQAGYNATTNILNSVLNGWKSAFNATTIEQSVVVGEESLLNTTVMQNTVCVGGNTKHTYSSLNKCTFIGEMAGEGTDAGITVLENSTCVGYNTAVTGNNQVQLGDVNTTTYVYGTVQNRSDMRDKADIRDTELGLDFINKLRPVDFKWNYRELYQDEVNDGSKKGSRYHHGLITQEVFEVIKETGKDFGGYQDHSLNGGSDVQSLGYDEFVAPLIKAVQELSEKCIILENRIKELENK